MSFLEEVFSLNGTVAVVTGAAGGIGSVVSQALGAVGAHVVLVDQNEGGLNDLLAIFHARRWRAETVVCDLAQAELIKRLAGHVATRHARIDTLINCAGVSHQQSLLTYPDDIWLKTFEVNVGAPFRLAKHLTPLMQERGGSIINVTSINAELGFPDNPAYIASKGALRQLSRSLAVDLGRYGIRVNNVGPSYFETDMTKRSQAERRTLIAEKTVLGRWGRPTDLVGLILLLSSNASSFITGQDFYVDGGWLVKGL